MARRKRGVRRRGRDWVQQAFNVLGGLVAGGPAIKVVVEELQQGSPGDIPGAVGYAYLGLGEGGIDWQRLVTGLSTVAAGGAVAAIPSIYRKVKRIFSGRR